MRDEIAGASRARAIARAPVTDDGYDRLERRCPRLGGPVSFGYCRTAGEGGDPCFKCLDCWWERFDVVEHLRRLSGDRAVAELARRRPPPKLTSLIDRIREARARTGNPPDGSKPQNPQPPRPYGRET